MESFIVDGSTRHKMVYSPYHVWIVCTFSPHVLRDASSEAVRALQNVQSPLQRPRLGGIPTRWIPLCCPWGPTLQVPLCVPIYAHKKDMEAFGVGSAYRAFSPVRLLPPFSACLVLAPVLVAS
jgi:hypothetical protein